MDEDTEIRPLRVGEAEALCVLIAALAAHHDDVAQVRPCDVVRDCLGPRAMARVLVAERGGRLVGYAALFPVMQMQLGRRGAELHHLFVAEDLRGAGLGTALVAAARDQAREMGADYMALGASEENLRAHGFCGAQGFEAANAAGKRFRMQLGGP